MTAYTANHFKKKRLLAKRERELIHTLKSNYSQAKLEKCAESVREAMLAVFKSNFAKGNELPPASYEANKKANVWKDMSVFEIIERYKQH